MLSGIHTFINELLGFGYRVSRQKEQAGTGPWIQLNKTWCDVSILTQRCKEKNCGQGEWGSRWAQDTREKAKCYLLRPELRERHFLLELEWQ